MKLSEMFETRKALTAERDSILAQDTMSVEVEARGHEVANELGKLDAEIRAAQVRERFASSSAIENLGKKTEERSMDIRASKKYEEQFVNYLRTGQMPEQRELISTASSSILIPKVYQDAVLKYLDANSIMRNLADLRTGVQGYQTLRFSTLKTADYTSAWTQADTGTVAATAADPLFKEVPLAPIPCLPKTEVSQQLILQSDAGFNVEMEVTEHLQRQLLKNLEWGYVAGSGTNAPTGIFTVKASTGVTTDINIVTATAGAGLTRAAAITAGATVAKLSEMRYTKLPAAYWGSASWILPQDTYAAIAGLLVNNVPIFVPSADAALVGAAPFTLMGLPVYITEYLPAHNGTATSGKNCIAVLGNISESFAIREWGPGMSITRDEFSLSGTARIRYQGMQFANSDFTRVNALVQLQVTNAGS
jgi:HK97 family phage major capsid protein